MGEVGTSVKRAGEKCQKSSPIALIISTVTVDISIYSLVVLVFVSIRTVLGFEDQSQRVWIGQNFVWNGVTQNFRGTSSTPSCISAKNCTPAVLGLRNRYAAPTYTRSYRANQICLHEVDGLFDSPMRDSRCAIDHHEKELYFVFPLSWYV